MMLLRRLARPLLASRFVLSGVDAIRDPGGHKVLADSITPLTSQIPQLAQQSPDNLVRLHGGLQAGAGVLLALGKLPRLSALVLAATMVPTALADRSNGSNRQQLAEDASLVGGLLLASVDTAGRPGLGWRARHRAEHTVAATRHRAEHTAAATRRTRRQARMAAKAAKAEAKIAAKLARRKLPG